MKVSDVSAFQYLPGRHSPARYQSPRSKLHEIVHQNLMSASINAATHLQWLAGQCLVTGVVFEAVTARAVSRRLPHPRYIANLVVHRTVYRLPSLEAMSTNRGFRKRTDGCGANEASGLFPIRGSEDGQDEVAYIRIYAAGRGRVSRLLTEEK